MYLILLTAIANAHSSSASTPIATIQDMFTLPTSTITIPPGVYTDCTINSQSGLLIQSTTKTINAYGVTFDCEGTGRGLTIVNATVTVAGLTIVNGATAGGEIGGSSGGSVLVAGGSATTLIDVSLLSSTSASTFGGGCLAALASTLTVQSSLISGCLSGDVGGNVYTYQSTLTMRRSTVSYGHQTNNVMGGGGMTLSSTVAELHDSIFVRNVALNLGDGGGLYFMYTTANLVNVSVIENYSDDTSEDFGGAGIYLYTSVTNITDSYIASNRGRCSGGGITITAGSLSLTNSEIFNNTCTAFGGGISVAGDVSLINTLIHGNTAGQGGGLYLYEGADLAASGSAVCQNIAYPAMATRSNVYCRATSTTEGLVNGCGQQESCGYGTAPCSLAQPAAACASCLDVAWAGANCSICDLGYYLDTTSLTCKGCPPGRFLSNVNSLGECVPCPAGTFVSGVNASSCVSCELGTFNSGMGVSACSVCSPETYTPVAGAVSCVTCPMGAECLGAVVKSLPGYYQFPGYHFGTCLPGYCLGGNACAENRMGPLCGLCVPGYITVKGVCTPCTEGVVSWSAVLGLIVLNAGFALYALYFQAIKHARVGIITFLGQTTSIMLANAIALPSTLKSIFAISSLVPGNSCLAYLDFYEQFLIALASPLFPAVVIALCFLIEVSCWRPARRRFKCNVDRFARFTNQNGFPDRYYQALWSVVLFTFLPLARALLAVQSCRAPYDGSLQMLLTEDTSIECRDVNGIWTPKYIVYRIISLALLAGFVYLLPIALPVLIEFLRRRRDLRDPKVRGKFGLLYLSYVHRFPWFEGLIQLRKVVVATIVTFSPTLDTTRIALAAVFAGLLFLHYNARPYQYPGDNALEAVSMLVLLALSIMLSSNWFGALTKDQGQTALIALVVVCAVFVAAAGVWALFTAYGDKCISLWRRMTPTVAPEPGAGTQEDDDDGVNTPIELLASMPRMEAVLAKSSPTKSAAGSGVSDGGGASSPVKRAPPRPTPGHVLDDSEPDEKPRPILSKTPRVSPTASGGSKRRTAVTLGVTVSEDTSEKSPVPGAVRRDVKSPPSPVPASETAVYARQEAANGSALPRPVSMPAIELPLNTVSEDRGRGRKARVLRQQTMATMTKLSLGPSTSREAVLADGKQWRSTDALLEG